jgi:hypothetical protein
MEELLRQSLAMTKEVAFLVANDTFPEDAVEAKNRSFSPNLEGRW